LKLKSEISEKETGKPVSGIVQKMNRLQDLAARIDCACSSEEILDIIRNEARLLIEHDLCFSALMNRANTHYVLDPLSQIAEASGLGQRHFSVEEGMPGWVVKNKVSFVGSMESVPNYSFSLEGKFGELGIKSLLVVPMTTGCEVIGTLVFGSVKEGSFSIEDQVTAQLLAYSLRGRLRMFHSARIRGKGLRRLNLSIESQTNLLQCLSWISFSVLLR